MKIKLEFKKSQLDEIIYALQHEKPQLPNITIIDKVYFYLYNDALKKLLKKQIDKAYDLSVKPFKMNLEYPLAAALYSELIKVETENDYRYNCIRMLIMHLRQKLD